jgi:putative addiction module killer protein
MNTIEKTQIFTDWFEALKDENAKKTIKRRIEYAEGGHFGDCGPAGEGVSEMRIHLGPGYRLYYFQQGKTIYWLLAGGDKDTQESDIRLAKTIKRRIQRGETC